MSHRVATKVAKRPRLAALVSLIREVIVAQGQERTSLAAAGAAFWLIIAIFPAALAVINIYGLIIGPQRIASALSALMSRDSGTLGGALGQQVQQAADADQTQLTVTLAISILVSVWGASAGAYSVARAIQLTYQLPPQSYLKARTRSVVAGFLAIIALGVIALAASLGTVALSRFSGADEAVATAVVAVPVVLIVTIVIMLGVFRYGIGRRSGLRMLLPGATVSSVALLCLAVGFGIYLDTVANYSAVYGAVAGIVIAMLFSYCALYVILLSATLNFKLSQRRQRRVLNPVGISQ